MDERVVWDGTLRTFDDPERKPGEPWVGLTSAEFHDQIATELDEIRGGPYIRAAVACQGIARIAMTERDERIRQAVAAGANVRELAEQLGLSRQQVYAIAPKPELTGRG